MSASLSLHDEVLEEVIAAHGGYVFAKAGDSFAAAFSRASDAVAAAQDSQERLLAAAWPGPSLRVRMGVHLGETQERDGNFFGSAVNTAARVEAVGHGGQVLVTEPVRTTAAIEAKDLGLFRLRDVDELTRLFQFGDGEFPPLRTESPESNLRQRPALC